MEEKGLTGIFLRRRRAGRGLGAWASMRGASGALCMESSDPTELLCLQPGHASGQLLRGATLTPAGVGEAHWDDKRRRRRWWRDVQGNE